MLLKIPKGWEISENETTPESFYLNRRQFLASMGVMGATTLGLLSGCTESIEWSYTRPLSEAEAGIYPTMRNPEFRLDRAITKESLAAQFNNFYEFSTKQKNLYKYMDPFVIRPWTVKVRGLVEKPGTFDPDDLIRKMPMEERLYRHRCVEAWAMAVPWTGFPMKALMDRVRPHSRARYVRFTTVRLDNKPGFRGPRSPHWPYTEGLTMAEAANPLTMLVTGIYGHPLPKQHGAPIRLVVPWKYGFKSIKSIVRIEFTDIPPRTFWNTLVPHEYGLRANVNPAVPHPRWSQATERMLGSRKRRPTLPFNGYGKYVAHLYAGSRPQ